jgi:hypothetical protein
MNRTVSNRGTFQPGWHGWLCILLIGLMLYNPFAGLMGSGDGLCYARLARNRATVGASELQHFSPVTYPSSQTDLDVDVPRMDVMQVVREKRSSADLRVAFPPQAEVFSQFWNRPPPTL